jgi:hypothetical protein
VNYELKNKMVVSEELLNDLTTKSWQEIESLQAQITNLGNSIANGRLRQLLNNLLTSYYVFTGGIEALAGELASESSTEDTQVEPVVTASPEILSSEPTQLKLPPKEPEYTLIDNETDYEITEPFEYFVDFDEPTGEPLTDKDLYNS